MAAATVALDQRVAWNHRGEVITCFTQKLDCTNSHVTETQAILSVVNLAISNRWEALVAESDCKKVIDCFLGLIEEVAWEIMELINEALIKAY
ncbi:hypothetical protein PanWU01x14_182030 [Parasponia andersonii]|uniref:RNase H type-1 domain-containing protein n=1 Tax=Parasponia andersonii TaxID=3476 RepID=A0A2P5C5L4_PARAD|nr:hypothetical protein PanWU01x14_182030 [Parasponia andersonii]